MYSDQKSQAKSSGCVCTGMMFALPITNKSFSSTEQVPDLMRLLVIVHADALIISTALIVLAPA